MSFRNPGNQHPYDKFWAILSVDKKGNEGICMLSGPFGPQLAVTGSKKNLEEMRKQIDQMDARMEAHTFGVKIVIAEYTRTGTIDV